jgi:hypothetical protein
MNFKKKKFIEKKGGKLDFFEYEKMINCLGFGRISESLQRVSISINFCV